MIIALVLYTPISDYIINNTEAVSSIQGMIQSRIYKEEEPKTIENNTEDGDFINEIEKYIKTNTEEIKANSAEYVSKEIAVAIVRGLTWIGLFVAVRIIVIFIKIFADLIEKIPIIKQFNKARRDNLRRFRGICCNLCDTCNYKFNSADV